MAYEAKKLVMAVLGGLLIAVLIISGFVWTGTLPVTKVKGMLIINVKDAPAELNELWLNISTVRVHREGWGNETWKEIPVVLNEFELMQLRNVSTVLAAGELPEGNYTEIRFQIFNAWANTTENEHQPLNVVANGWVMVKVHFTIEEPPVISVVLIDIDVNEEPILNTNILMPVAKASVDYIE